MKKDKSVEKGIGIEEFLDILNEKEKTTQENKIRKLYFKLKKQLTKTKEEEMIKRYVCTTNISKIIKNQEKQIKQLQKELKKPKHHLKIKISADDFED